MAWIPLTSTPPTGATSRRRPPRGAFLRPRPMAVVGYSRRHTLSKACTLPRSRRWIYGERSAVSSLADDDRSKVNIETEKDTHGLRADAPKEVSQMNFGELLILRVRAILFWIQRHFVLLLLTGLCCLIGFEFGRVGLRSSPSQSLSRRSCCRKPCTRAFSCHWSEASSVPLAESGGSVRVACISFGYRFSDADIAASVVSVLTTTHPGVMLRATWTPICTSPCRSLDRLGSVRRQSAFGRRLES